jgi:hypothetical protein
MKHIALVIALALTLTPLKTQQPSKEAASKPCGPTATEIFHLRTECSNLAEKMHKRYSEDDHYNDVMADVTGQLVAHDADPSITHTSHYSPESNRCYVRFSVFNASSKEPRIGAEGSAVFDAQSLERLAQAGVSIEYQGSQIKSQSKSGNILAMPFVGDSGYSAAMEYMDNLMAEKK